jgi:hypothetical protein
MAMILENTLLERLSEWRPGPGQQELHLTADGWHVAIKANRSDELGCLLWDLNLQREGTADTDVQTWSANCASGLTVMGPLKVVEVDANRKEAQLRSESPLQRSDKRLYFELMLNGLGVATLQRFQVAENAKREQLPFALTHEVLAKVVADIADCTR